MSTTYEAVTEPTVELGALHTLARLWPMLSHFRNRFLAGAGLILVSTSIEIVTPIVVGRAVDAATAVQADRSLLVHLCLIFLVLIAIRAVLESVQSYVIQTTGQRVTDELRCRVFEKLERLPVPYFDSHPTGRLLTRVINDIKSLSELFTASISVLALDFMTIIGTVCAMFWVEPKLSAVVLLGFPAVVATILVFGKKLAIAYRLVRARLSEINSFLGENIGAIAVIQRLCAEDQRLEKFQTISDRHLDAQLDSTRVFALVQPIANGLNGLAIASLLGVGGYWVIHGRITLGVLVAFLGYLRNLFQPIRDLVEKYNTFLSATIAAERVIGVLGEAEETAADKGTVTEPTKGGYSIRFEDVTFQYARRRLPALHSVSFEVPAGKSLAVVGATGSGKSTLIRLLLRFYAANSGVISFGGQKLEDWDRYALRRQIGVVQQEIYLLLGSLRDNLTLGQTQYTDAYLIEQCKRAQLWDFVEARGGLDMEVQEGGTNLSLGERQLISFARVLVFDTPVLIFDEATSSMDRLLERRLMDAVKETLAGRTSIVIAHRLATIQRCDQIIVLEQAQLKEQGTYASLLAENGLFAQFHHIYHQA